MNSLERNIKIRWHLALKSQGMTLLEVVMAMGLFGVFTFGLMTSMNMIGKMQSTMKTSEDFNVLMSYINQVVINDSSCNTALQAWSASNGPTNPFTFSSDGGGPIKLYNVGTAGSSVPFVEPKSRFGSIFVQSINLYYDTSSGQSLKTGPIASDPTTQHYSTTDVLYRGMIQVTATRGTLTGTAKVSYGTSLLTNFTSTDLSSPDAGTPVAVRLDTSRRLISCTGLRAGSSTVLSLMPVCSPGFSADSDGGSAIKCKRTNCDLGQIPQGINSDGSLKCVSAPCGAGKVPVYMSSTSSFVCKQIVCPAVNGVPTLPTAYDTDGYVLSCGSGGGTYAVSCTPSAWSACNGATNLKSRTYSCVRPSFGPVSTYTNSVFYCTSDCSAKQDIEPCGWY